MSAAQTRLLIAAACFVFIFLTGFLLRGSEKPFNVAVFTIHKLAAVGVLIFLAVTVYRIHQQDTLTALELAISVLSGVLFLGTIVTGSALSIERSVSPAFLTLHQILPFATVISVATMVYTVIVRHG